MDNPLSTPRTTEVGALVERLRGRIEDRKHGRDNSGTWPIEVRSGELHDLLTALETLSAQVAGQSMAIDQAAFLCDRLGDLDWSRDIDGLANDYGGHVDPALSRLKRTLAALSGEDGRG